MANAACLWNRKKFSGTTEATCLFNCFHSHTQASVATCKTAPFFQCLIFYYGVLCYKQNSVFIRRCFDVNSSAKWKKERQGIIGYIPLTWCSRIKAFSFWKKISEISHRIGVKAFEKLSILEPHSLQKDTNFRLLISAEERQK